MKAAQSSRRVRQIAVFAIAGTVASLSRLAAVRRGAKAIGHWIQKAINKPRGRLLHETRMADADDVVLADRVRSSIGPLLAELDTPRIHVTAEGSRLLLHGDIVSQEGSDRVVEAVRRVPGVGKVDSFLRIGLLPGDSRPSNGQASPGSTHEQPM
jgi:malonyl CoA-acyl carrier protein transacylase